jgi:hypothetical protein
MSIVIHLVGHKIVSMMRILVHKIVCNLSFKLIGNQTFIYYMIFNLSIVLHYIHQSDPSKIDLDHGY